MDNCEDLIPEYLNFIVHTTYDRQWGSFIEYLSWDAAVEQESQGYNEKSCEKTTRSATISSARI